MLSSLLPPADPGSGKWRHPAPFYPAVQSSRLSAESHTFSCVEDLNSFNIGFSIHKDNIYGILVFFSLSIFINGKISSICLFVTLSWQTHHQELFLLCGNFILCYCSPNFWGGVTTVDKTNVTCTTEAPHVGACPHPMLAWKATNANRSSHKSERSSLSQREMLGSDLEGGGTEIEGAGQEGGAGT